MNKKLLIVSFLVGGIAAVSSLYASARLDATYSTVEITASSSSLTNKPTWVKSVQLSTPTNGSTYGANWAVLIDTVPPNPGLTYDMFTSSRKRSIPLIFTSTPTAVVQGPAQNANVYTFDEPGIFFSSGVYLYKTQASSGEAFKVLINFKQ